jgi:hypothetical protein
MEDLHNNALNYNVRLCSFHINDIYTNIPKHNEINKLINMLRTTSEQNYFQFENQYNKQSTGLAMGTPHIRTSSWNTSPVSRSAVPNLLTSADPHWITTGSPRIPEPFLRFEPQNNTQIMHNKQIHKLRTILFNSQTKKNIKNRNFNFNRKIDAVSVLKF